jgi:hypothetical protein
MRPRWVLVLGFVAVCLAADGTPAGAQRESLPPELRRGLSQRMAGHGRDMEQLVWSVVLLQHRDARELARGISRMERVSEDTPHVPSSFVVLQDAMLQAASALAHAAERGQEEDTARAFGVLMRSCVACHSQYLP